MQEKTSTFEPFRTRAFRMMWTATLFSNLGGLVQGVAASWLMSELTPSHAMVGLVQGAMTLPVVVFSLMAGALADNFNRRQIMISAQLMMMAVSITLAAFTFLGWNTPSGLLMFTFLIGCGTALYNPAWQATVGDIVPRRVIPSAVTLNSVGFNMMRSVGPAVGGAIVNLLGTAFAFIFNAFSYIPLLVVMYFWKPEYHKSKLPRERLMGAMSDGLRYVLMSPHLSKIMLRAFLFGFGAITILAQMPIIARDIVHGNEMTFGILLGAFGIGALIGGIINAAVRERVSSEKIIAISFAGYAASCYLLSLSASVWLSCLILLPAGLFWVLALSLFNVSVQLSTPRWVVSRALALYQTCSFGGMALGSWVWGAIADQYTIQTTLTVCAVFLLLGALAGFKLPIQEIGSTNFAPSDEFRAPELRLDLLARSGPIMILVDYTIAENDVPVFLEAMAKRRRIRLRDGARQWTLLRDLENPEQWTETYHMPTWVEYLRHNQRRTQDDMEIIEFLHNLNQGSAEPHVHRMIERHTVPHAHEMHLKPPPEL
ncbi:MAG: Transmembrane secretion effector protein [Candidatus Tokpelaia hoelldobleri]|uniref:Transmembrane secretion effector protein n=1 Tax=Candidatus Tokpelaia hoelldobleri TaxID=1902579 RepID=A0A1U9JW94_9HYPH|nr:MAG: Transmembrane secretion effector protein [Candidatus Tokpelaia hoelldoblerii]